MKTHLLWLALALMMQTGLLHAEDEFAAQMRDDLRRRRFTYEQILEAGRQPQHRKEVVRQLIEIVQQMHADPMQGNLVKVSIQLLGELKAEEAIEPLADRLMYIRTNKHINFLTPMEAHYPCALALERIGKASIGALVKKIGASKDSEERNEAAWVIMEIEGSEAAMARMAALAKERLSEKPRFDEAWKYIKSYKVKLYHPIYYKTDPEYRQWVDEGRPSTLQHPEALPAP